MHNFRAASRFEAIPDWADERPTSQAELIHADELRCEPASMLCQLEAVGELLCFARNRHCIIGFAGCLPELQPSGPFLRGSSEEVCLCLDTASWRFASATHERAPSCGMLTGIEFFDDHHCALFRTALTPDSDRMAYQAITQAHYQRCLPPEEFDGWRRLAEMPRVGEAKHVLPSEELLAIDAWNTPLEAWGDTQVCDEMGFPGDFLLAYAVFSAVIEEGQSLVITVVGAFGQFSLPFQPAAIERVQRGWIYVGGEGRMLRFNTQAIANYWVGRYSDSGQNISYLEAVDAHGDLIFRLTSDHEHSFQYWQALARNR